MEPIILGEAKKEPDFAMPFDEGHQTNEEQVIKHPDTEFNCKEPIAMEESNCNEQSVRNFLNLSFH